jgi:hypothetical protein
MDNSDCIEGIEKVGYELISALACPFIGVKWS